MQFSNLLPCIVALITPALAQAPLTTWVFPPSSHILLRLLKTTGPSIQRERLCWIWP